MENQSILISNRNMVSINNVNNVISFNENEFVIQTPYGNLKILGKDLAILKMDTNKKELSIKGLIESLAYTNNTKTNKKEKKESIFSKIFK